MNETGRVGPAFLKITGKAGKPNGHANNGGLWDHEAQELVQNFSDFEWGVLSAINPTVRAYVGFDDLDALDDDSWDALQMGLIEAKKQIDAFIQKF
jgi:hypothetical protein